MESKDNCIERAEQIRKQGYNCAQTVLMTFAPELGIDTATAAKVCCGLGGGIAGCGEVCGVPVAMTCAAGLLSEGKPTDKAGVYKEGAQLMHEFGRRHGSVLCRELKASGRPCSELILDGVRMLDEYISEKKENRI